MRGDSARVEVGSSDVGGRMVVRRSGEASIVVMADSDGEVKEVGVEGIDGMELEDALCEDLVERECERLRFEGSF